jgi:carboxypeptidase PM20D1
VLSDSYRLLAATVEAVVPDAVVAPALVVVSTDTKHYGRIAENSYRFDPFRLGPGDASRIHGVDERISIPAYDEVIRFYEALLRSGLDPAGARP